MGVKAQTPVGHIGFYNVENLFDTFDDPEINDDDFTPKGRLKWDSIKYDQKLRNISKVIKTMGAPDIVGLCEVENNKANCNC